MRNKLFLVIVVLWVSIASVSLFAQGNPNDLLLEAAGKGSVTQLRNAISQGGDVNAVDSKGNSALYITVDRNRKAQFDILLQAGANVNFADSSGKQIVVVAIEKIRANMLKPLLDKGVSPETQSPDGKTLIVIAVEKFLERWDNSRLGMVRDLIQARANTSVPMPKGHTVLQEFANQGWHAFLREAFSQGADANVRDRNNNLLIHLATKSNAKNNLIHPTIDLLLSKGQNINWEGERKMTPLLLAAEKNDLARVAHILKKRPNVNAKNDKGETALSFAVKTQNANMIRTLIRSGASPNIRNAFGNPLVMELCGTRPEATNNATFGIMNQLITGASVVNTTNQYGNNCLSYAITQQNTKMIQYLIGKGANPNQKDRAGNTSLHKVVLASLYGRVKNDPLRELMETLLDNGADPAITDNNGQTPLHYAATPKNNRDSVGGLQSMDILMNYSVDPGIKDSQSKTAANYATGFSAYNNYMSRVTATPNIRNMTVEKEIVYATQTRGGEIYIVTKEGAKRTLVIYTSRGMLNDSFEIPDGDFVQADSDGNVWTAGVAPGSVGGKTDSRCRQGQNLVVSIRKYSRSLQEVFQTTIGRAGACAATSIIDLQPNPQGEGMYLGVLYKRERNLVYIDTKEDKVKEIAKPPGVWTSLAVSQQGNAIIKTGNYSEFDASGKRVKAMNPVKIPGLKLFYVNSKGNFSYAGIRRTSKLNNVVWARGYKGNQAMQWGRTFSSGSSDDVSYLYVDPSDNLYMIIQNNAIQFHGYKNPKRKTTAYLVKLNPDGMRAFTAKIPSDHKKGDNWNIEIGSSTIFWKKGGKEVFAISEGTGTNLMNIIPGF